jgi:protease YdgD
MHRCARAVALVLMLVVVQRPALAQDDVGSALDRPVLPGLGPHDGRMRADPNRVPWRAVGKLQANTGNLHASCTGTLIAPAQVLTAAHCLINPRTRTYFPPSSLHFLIGYDHGVYAGHALALKFMVAPGFDLTHPTETSGSDWAVLTIDKDLGNPDRILKLRDQVPAVGTKAMIGGYEQDQPLVLIADTACKIVALTVDRDGHRMLHHNCAATRGVSGAPLLVREGSEWRVAGIDVMASIGATGGIAVDIAGLSGHP